MPKSIQIVILLALSIVFCSLASAGQDIIILRDGQEIESRVVSVKDGYVTYKKFSNLSGPDYSLKQSDIFMIKYENGEKDVFSNTTDSNPAGQSQQEPATFSDPRDGKIYQTVMIGEQTWMAVNLDYEAIGTPCEDEGPVCKKCGQYYNYQEALNACPPGWHLPGDDEWIQLEVAIGMANVDARKTGWRGTPPGQAFILLEGGTSGLDLCICGHYYGNKMKYFNKEAFYWTATMQDKRNVWIRHFIGRASIDRVPNPADLKMSVRCLKDEE